MTRTARRIAAPLALAATLAGSASALASPPVITATAADEGQALTVPITARCEGAKRCAYTATTVDGTALAGSDYTPATTSGSVKKNKTFAGTLTITTTDDAATEPAETLTVRVTVTRGAKVATFTATETINASDAIAADTGTPTETTTTTTSGTLRECRTPMWTGVAGQAGANGNFIAGCKVTVQCPPTAKLCRATNSSSITNETAANQTVTLNTRTRAITAAGAEFFFRDKSCAGTDACSATDTVVVRGGESVSVECNGVRSTAPKANRSSVRCALLVERTQ